MSKNRQKSNQGEKSHFPTLDSREKLQKVKPILSMHLDEYLVDSGKFLIDKDLFTSVHIPENYTLIDAETGEKIEDFKKKSLSIPFKNHKIYVSNLLKQEGRHQNDKILIFFPAKICDNYLSGIRKNDVISVLEFLKTKGYLIFSDAEKIYNEICCNDLDIKRDILYPKSSRPEIKEYWEKSWKHRFTGPDDQFALFDSNARGLGVQCYKRETSTPTKAFFKFYDKTKEIQKDKEFFKTIQQEIQNIIQDNFLLRYEFTLKNKKHFDRHEISNKLKDVLEIPQETWKKIGREILHSAFETKKNQKKFDIDKLRYPDRLLSLFIMTMYQKDNRTKGAIQSLFISIAKDKVEKCRAKKQFDRLWSITTTPQKFTSEMYSIMEKIEKWDRYFGLIN